MSIESMPQKNKNNSGFTLLNNFAKGKISARRNLTGFTLIELIVSVTIIALITGLFLANYHSANRRNAINIAGQKLVRDIRLVQGYAVGSRKDANGYVPYWGIYFSKANQNNIGYIIFNDATSTPTDSGRYVPASDVLVQRINLPQGIIIKDIRFDSVPVSSNELSLVLVPPDPINQLSDSDDERPGVSAQIILQDQDPSNPQEKTISINSFGLAEVSD